MLWPFLFARLLLLLLLAVTSAQAGAGGSDGFSDSQKRVIVVIGSTGSSKAVHIVLQAAGVWMHPDRDAALNSELYRDRVLQPLLPLLQLSAANQTGAPDWALLHYPTAMYNLVVPPTSQQNVTQWHEQMAADMLQAVPDNATTWGWQHPLALFTLPQIHKAFPSLHVIHQVQDGRDYALSHLLKKHRRGSTQQVELQDAEHCFTQLLTGVNASDHQQAGTTAGRLAHSMAAASAWALANKRALGWAGQQGAAFHGTHSVVRLEDLCDPDRQQEAVATMLRNAQLPHDQDTVSKAVRRLRQGRQKHWAASLWQAAANSRRPRLAAAVRAIERATAPTLEAFDYTPASALELPPWLEAPHTMQRIVAAGRAAAGPTNHPIILTHASNGYERILSNWLAWLQDSGADTSHVVVAVREGGYKAAKRAAAGTGAVVVSMPLLTPYNSSSHDELGRETDAFRNVRGGLWLERVRSVYELTQHGMSVLLTDLDAIWLHNPLPYLLSAAAAIQGQQQPLPYLLSAAATQGQHQPGEGFKVSAATTLAEHQPPGEGIVQQPNQGFDLVLSRGKASWSAAFNSFGAGGCMGFAFFNATQPTSFLLRGLLRERLRQLSVSELKYFNDQRHLNQALEAADLQFNASLTNTQLARLDNSTALAAWKLTTAPTSLRVLYMPPDLAQRDCGNDSSSVRFGEALIAHCQSAKSGQEKEAYLKQLGLWKPRPNRSTHKTQGAPSLPLDIH